MKNSNRAYFYAFLSVALWSTVATSFKIGLKYLDAGSLLLYSSLTSTLLFIFPAILQKEAFFRGLTPLNIARSALYGALNPFLYYLILFEAYSLLPAQIAQPLNYTWVIVVSLLSAFFLRQRFGFSGYLGLLAGFSGVVVISAQGSVPGFDNINTTGVALALGSSVFWGLYWLLNLLDKRDDTSKLLLNFLFGSIFIFIYNLITGNIRFNPEGLAAGIYIGLFEMGITFFLWLKALQYSDNAARTGNIIYLSPFISLVFISLVLEETISLNSVLGLALIVSGILIQKYLKRPTK